MSPASVDLARGLFVTGTDTGVGKTVASAVVAACWAAADLPVTYVKPAQSGDDDGDDDARDVAAWVPGVRVRTGTVLGESLAPAVAARRAGVVLHRNVLAAPVDAVRRERPDDRVVVEGAGGLLVELGTDGTTCADLAEALQLPVLVVARPGLGTLNHTALTLVELQRRGLDLAGVLVCGYPDDPDLATRTNLAELDRWSGGRLVGVVPRLAALTAAAFDGAPGWCTTAIGGTATRADLLRDR